MPAYDWPVSIETGEVLPHPPLPKGKVTYEQFLDWLDDNTHAEWVDGEIVLMSPVEERHDAIVGFLRALIRHLLEHDDLGRELSEPFQVRLPEPLRRGRSPDIIVVLNEHDDRLRRTYVDGAPDLIVEVISRESRRRDQVEKLAEYEAAGVAEYWAVDFLRTDARFYLLGPDGKYQLVLSGAEGVFQSRVLPRLRLPLEWLWRDRPPKVMDALRELGLL